MNAITVKLATASGTNKPLAILRPKVPALALKLARELVGKEDDAAFQAILSQQEYRFVGWLAIGNETDQRKVLNPVTGNLEELQPGDSMVEGEMENGQPVLRQ